MPALIEYRCPRCRHEFTGDGFGRTPSGGRATLCHGCAAAPRRRGGPSPAPDDGAEAIDAPAGWVAAGGFAGDPVASWSGDATR